MKLKGIWNLIYEYKDSIELFKEYWDISVMEIPDCVRY